AAQEIALAVQHHHRMGAAVEDVDLVLAVDRDGSDIAELPAVRQLRKIFDDAVAVLAGAENGWHGLSLCSFWRRDRPHTVIASAAKQSRLSLPKDSGLFSCACNDEA